MPPSPKQPFILTYWTQIVAVAGLIGAGYLSIYRLDQAEASIKRVESELKAQIQADREKTLATTEEIRTTLGVIQLDMALVCTEIVRTRGGNPMVECRTMGGAR